MSVSFREERGTDRAYSSSMLRCALACTVVLGGCGSDDRAPGLSGEHPSGMSTPVSIVGQGSTTTSARIGFVREIPSLMRWPTLGDAPPADVIVTFGGMPLDVRDGRFNPGYRSGWFGVERAGVRVLANIEPLNGELTLPLLRATATGVPRADRAAVVFQLTDNLGEPMLGVTAASKPGVIGPCYDNSDDRVQDVPRTTNRRGAIAYLEIPMTKNGTFETELNILGRPMVAQVPIVAGTVTFLRTSIQ